MSNKKKKRRNLGILILLTILCIGAYIGLHLYMASKNNADEETATEESAGQILSATTDEAVKLSYEAGDDKVTLVKEDSTWKLSSDKDCPIDQTKVTDMLAVFSSTEATKKIADNDENNAEYGLDKPALKATLTLKDKSTVSYQVGIAAIGDSDGYYVSVSGDDAIYLAPVTVNSAFQYFGKELIAIEETPEIEAENIYAIDVKKGNDRIFTAKEDEEGYVITSPYKKGVSADSSTMSSLLSNYTTYTFTQNTDYACKDFSKYGLDNPSYKITVNYYESTEDSTASATDDANESSENETKGEKKTFTLSIGDKDKSGNYYVRMSGSDSVYTMEASSVNTLIEVSAFSAVSKQLFSMELDSVKKITFKTDAKTYTMTVDAKEVDDSEEESEEETSTYNATFDGKEMDDETATSLYSKLTAVEYKGEVEKAKESDQVVSVEIVYGTKGQSKKTFTIYTMDSEYDRVEMDGVSYFTVDKRTVDELLSELKNM